MKKTPNWVKEVIYFTQTFPDAEIRNQLLDELCSGSFDYTKFLELCRNCHFAFDEFGRRITIINEKSGLSNEGAFMNQWEAIGVAGKEGTIVSMMQIIREHFNEAETTMNDKAAVDVGDLIDEKLALEKELIITYDTAKAFTLKKQIKALEQEIQKSKSC